MKKVLYGTTALVSMALVSGVAAADEKMKVSVNGYAQQWITVVQEDNDCTAFGTCAAGTTPKVSGVDFKHNTEIWFKGSKKLDNGITVGIDVQMEGDQPPGGPVGSLDETYMWFSSPSLGKLILGDENNAAYLLHSWPTNGGVSVASGDVINVAAFRKANSASYYNTAMGTSNIRAAENDVSKITYLSPVFYGFQVGASYWPEAAAGGGQAGNASASRLANYHDGFAFGAKYAGKFSGVGVGASFGYLMQDPMGGLNTAAFVATGTDTDIEQWNAGLKLSYMGFTVTGNYNTINDGMMTSALTFDSSSWTVSGSYKTGPYTVGVQWFSGEAEDAVAVAGDDEHDVLMISGGYQLGAGVRLVAGIYTFDQSDDAATPTTSNDGWGLMVGSKVSF
jgi:hypothetical protein